MIQDIFPHTWDIAYKNCRPEDNSFIFFFGEGQLLLLQEPDGTFDFPRYKQVEAFCKQMVYLFSLDGEDCFRQNVSKEDAQKLDKQFSNAKWVARSFFRKAKPKEKAFAAITGMHLDGWYQKNVFCGCCGEKLSHDKKERMLRCASCNNMVFPRINPAVIVGITDGNRLLLTKYNGREYKNYALVAGFNEIGESLEETVRREVYEETGLNVKEISYYKSQPWGFTDNILVGYFCSVDGDTTIRMDAEELSVASWFEAEEIDVVWEDLSLTNDMICHFIKEHKR